MNVNTEMDALGTALGTITNLRVFDFVPKNAEPPFAFVDYPEQVTYDSTMARGKDEATFPVFVAVADISDRAGRDQLGEYLNGSGSKSIKAALDSGGLRRVSRAEVLTLTMGGQEFIAARFDVEVIS
jgi:hypothetical protein